MYCFTGQALDVVAMVMDRFDEESVVAIRIPLADSPRRGRGRNMGRIVESIDFESVHVVLASQMEDLGKMDQGVWFASRLVLGVKSGVEES